MKRRGQILPARRKERIMSVSGLDTALSGLRIAQQQLNVISNNVSNVGTDGYTRKILPQESMVVGGQGIGVRSSAVIRNVDLNLERDLWTQVSSVNFLDVQSSYLDKIQQFHGSPDSETNIAAQISALRDAFSALADSPEDAALQRNVVNQAKTVAGKMNALSDLFTQMRNDAENQIAVDVAAVNTSLQKIANLNQQIKFAKASGRTSAEFEDQRDSAIKDLSQKMEISFFQRGDGVLVVQTANGVQLADERAETLTFQPGHLDSGSTYPESANGIYVGNPATQPTAIDITSSRLNGEIGALIDIRDNAMPRQQAMLDELAQKMALRFDQQGLRLFTDASGQVPADTAPAPSPPAPVAVPVTYVGFSSRIRVNAAVLADQSLVQKGTVATDKPVTASSNEVISRVAEYAFSDIAYQKVSGTVDLRASGAGDSLQEWLGIYSRNQVTGAKGVSQYGDLAALVDAGGEAFTPPSSPTLDKFSLTFEEPRTGLGPVTVTIDLSDAAANFPIGGAIKNAADQVAAEINAQIAAASVPAGLAASASVNSYGQLVLNSRGNITVDNAVSGGMPDAGLGFLGLARGTTQTTDPYIDIAVGNDNPTRITIEPGDDETDFIGKLNLLASGDTDGGVEGLAVSLSAATGRLSLRPGDDPASPAFGGALTILGSSFSADGTGTVTGGIPAGTTIVSALFGSDAPVANVTYASATPSGGAVAFRSRNLGPGADIDTGIITSSNIIDYAQKMVNRQSEEANEVASKQTDETSYHDLLQRRLLDSSGVNIDEELSSMIVVQTAFAAAAKVISAINDEFSRLMDSI
jgi:flagellar hook-associated protein 1 FlgK